MNIQLAIPAVAATLLLGASALPANAASTGGFFGDYFYSDGTQAFNSRAIAGAAPNANATYLGGVRCEFRYVVTPQGRKKFRHCE